MREFRLCDEDRERLGCDEWLPWDVLAISLDDLDELAGRFDFDPQEWPAPLYGELTLEQAGDPEAKPVPPKWQRRAALWMALRQNGHDVSWDEAGKLRHLKVTGREVPGKDEESSTDSGSSTTPPSPSSSD